MRNRDTGAIELSETMEREALFRALERSLMEDLRASIALEALFAGAVPPEFEPLRRMKTTAQSPVHHPEGNVWNHTMLVVDEAAKRRAESKDPAALMWAALLHKTTESRIRPASERGKSPLTDMKPWVNWPGGFCSAFRPIRT